MELKRLTEPVQESLRRAQELADRRNHPALLRTSSESAVEFACGCVRDPPHCFVHDRFPVLEKEFALVAKHVT